MHKTYWLDRWERKEIDFHQTDINPYLQKYWHRLAIPSGSEVFVPMCGKSHDMLWIYQQEQAVLGVELSDSAALSFFQENNLPLTRTEFAPFIQLEYDHLQILCGDFFDLTKEHVQHVQAVYDRAAMIALPPEMRKRYVNHLLAILPKNSPILLIALDYPDLEMSGPPFAVTSQEVLTSYCSYANIELLAQHDVLLQNPRFQERGLSRLCENIYLISN
ncbi:thiopurine S-methyltransferase [Nitrosomonas sp. PY1]|uniref:thiopurine S-methyltransferase n=1 Tax=Nitrosomonas sp. PY1 TaxID=1803906 RepID=UPI001FC83F79|nr:thiopurine S-methyltransferase [Nitrosomonas sp. PY1]GKS69306.1 thiopurine S-methyltransferase [Nitrosomonas sp. PY1]